MGLLSAKVGAFLVLLLSSLLMGLIPFKLASCLKRRSGGKNRASLTLSCLQCLGGGVLLATVFAHMLPEVREAVEKALGKLEFPLAEVLVCCGLFSIYLLEELGMLCARRDPSAEYSTMDGAEEEEEETAEDEERGDRVLYDARQGSALLEEAEREYGAVTGSRRRRRRCPPPPESPPNLGSFRVLIVAVALSVHSVFEGMAIGLEATEASTWLLTAAIATHKSIIAFCLGEQLAASVSSTQRALATLAAFVLASPTGIVLGTLVTSSSGGHMALTAVLQALAAGTILYVVIFEIIGGERAKPGSGLAKLAAILAGFSFMLLMVTVVQEPEEAPMADPQR
ncbi:zinc transporter ZIP2-like [Pollicipes pollicipes]|uniref:zinc transporter ZIP2-like n=1 Tax=Pollicipes pollicipes TaxID=41117 RepID=UPI0018856E97|nr:zinc transporter ZIP2-like [Pollicipes pollicipes]